MTAVLHPMNIPDAHTPLGSHCSHGVGDTNSQTPTFLSTANQPPASAPNFPDAHAGLDSHRPSGVGDQATETAQFTNGSQSLLGGLGSDSEDGADAHRTPDSHVRRGLGPILADPTLAMCADVVDDLERVKIANQNRLRTLTAGGEHGHGLTLDHPDIKRLAALVDALATPSRRPSTRPC